MGLEDALLALWISIRLDGRTNHLLGYVFNFKRGVYGNNGIGIRAKELIQWPAFCSIFIGIHFAEDRRERRWRMEELSSF